MDTLPRKRVGVVSRLQAAVWPGAGHPSRCGGGADRRQERLDGGPLGIRRAGRGEDGPVHGALGDRTHGDSRMSVGSHELR